MASNFTFWAVEVKPGQPLSCEVKEESVIHISQATLGECEDASVNLFVSTKTSAKVVIGTLLPNAPPLRYDLVFGKEFELSHNSKTASISVCGFKVDGVDSTKDKDEAVPKAPPVDDEMDSVDVSSLHPADPEGGKNRVTKTALKSPASHNASIATASGETAANWESKMPGNKKPNGKPPKSHSCKSCDRTFRNDSALQSHKKAKHT